MKKIIKKSSINLDDFLIEMESFIVYQLLKNWNSFKPTRGGSLRVYELFYLRRTHGARLSSYFSSLFKQNGARDPLDSKLR